MRPNLRLRKVRLVLWLIDSAGGGECCLCFAQRSGGHWRCHVRVYGSLTLAYHQTTPHVVAPTRAKPLAAASIRRDVAGD
jgi:hypothetical protein